MPPAMPPATARRGCGPRASRSPGAIWTITWAIAPTPTPSRNAASAGVNAAAPIHAPTHGGAAGEQPEHRQAADRGARAAAPERGDDGQALGRVVDREADDEEGAERERAGRVGRADGQALAEVVQADAERRRARQALRRARPRRRPRPRARRRASETAVEREVGEPGAQRDEAGAAERLGALAGDLERLERRVDGQEAQQADRRGHQDADPGGVDAAHERQPQHAQRHRDDADVEPEQRHEAEEPEVGARGLDRGGDLVRERRAGRGQQADLVGLALDPRVGDRDRLGARGGRPRRRATSKSTIGVVDEGLREGHRIGPVVAHGQLDRARLAARCARPRAPRPPARDARRAPAPRAPRRRRARRRPAAAGRARAARPAASAGA